MFSVPFIVASLYPHRSLEEQQAIVDAVFEKGAEYYHRTWNGVVTVEMLKDEQVKLNLIKTIFFSQTRYWGAIDEILRSLSEWSQGTLIFPELTLVEDQLFYLRYFTFLGFINFADIETERQLHLLHGECLLIAALWDVPIYISVQEFFAKYTDINFLKEYSKLFATVIENNLALLGPEGKGGKKIGEWAVKLYEQKDISIIERVDKFIEEDFEVQRLPQEDKIILGKVLALYWGLKGGFIWREIGKAEIAGIEKKKPGDPPVLLEEEYIKLLSEGNSDDITVWLRTYKDVVEWIRLTGQSEEFVFNLFEAIKDKIDFTNQEQVDFLFKFINALKEDGLDQIDDIVYFDEETGKMAWNDDVVPPDSSNIPQAPAEEGKTGQIMNKDEYTKLKEGLSS